MILKLSNRRQGWYYYEVEKVTTRIVTKDEYCGEKGHPLAAYDLNLVDGPAHSQGKTHVFDPPCFRALEISYQKKGQDEGGTVCTSHAAYLMNDEGRTIEVLNPDPGDQILHELTEEEKEPTAVPGKTDRTGFFAPAEPRIVKPKPNPGITHL